MVPDRNLPNTYLSYFGIPVTDLERSVRLYSGYFGLEEVARVDNRRQGAGLCVLLRDPRSGSKLELNYYPLGSRFGGDYSIGEGLDHLCFRVENLGELLQKLKAEGVEPVDLPSEIADGGSIVYMRSRWDLD